MTTNLEVANTILAQLGGNRFIAMTGCKNFAGSVDSLTFHTPQRMCSNKAKFCFVYLDHKTDTYLVRFMKTSKDGLTTISEHERVYGDNLASLFSDQTGMAVSL